MIVESQSPPIQKTPLPFANSRRRGVVAERVVVVVEVPGLRPLLELGERLDRPGRVVARAGDVVDPVPDRRGLHVRAPDAAEEVDEAVALLVALLDHRFAVGQLRAQLGEQPIEAREGRGHLVRVEAELAELLLVVEGGDVLAGLRDAPDGAFAERLAVGRPAEHPPGRRRVEPVPAVLLDVLRERQDQLRLHELRVGLVALVPLGHVGPAAGRERARHRADEAVEVLEDEVDLHARDGTSRTPCSAA